MRELSHGPLAVTMKSAFGISLLNSAPNMNLSSTQRSDGVPFSCAMSTYFQHTSGAPRLMMGGWISPRNEMSMARKISGVRQNSYQHSFSSRSSNLVPHVLHVWGIHLCVPLSADGARRDGSPAVALYLSTPARGNRRPHLLASVRSVSLPTQRESTAGTREQ